MRRCAPLRRYAVDAAPVPGRPAAGAAGRGPLLACLLLGVAPWVGACATKAPTIRVDSATIRERSEDGTLVNLELTLGNNNTGEIVLGEFEYTVTAGSTFAGRRRAGVTLAPLSTTKVLLPAVLVGPPVGSAGAAQSSSATSSATSNAASTEITDLRIVGDVGWRGSTDLERAFYLSGLRRPQQSFTGAPTIE